MSKPNKTPEGKWRIRYDAGINPLTGERRQKGETFGSEAEAKRRLRAIAVAKDENRLIATSRTPFGVWLSMWLRDWVRVDASTLRNYRSKVKMIGQAGIAKIKLRDLQPEHLQTFYRALEDDGRAPGTIRGYAHVISASLNAAVELKKIPTNPAQNPAIRKSLPANVRPERPTYAFPAIAKLLEVSTQPKRKEDHDTWPAVAFIVLTGLRVSEALGLKRNAVHLDDGYIEVKSRQQVLDLADNGGESRRNKDGAKSPRGVRDVVLPPEALELLRRHLARQAKLRLEKWGTAYQDHELVFCLEWGEPLGPWNIRSAFRRLQLAAGLERLKVHDLRHTYASRSLDAGNPLEEVSKTIGHSSVKITGDVYAHTSRERKRESAERYSQALQAATRQEDGPEVSHGAV